MNRVLFSGLAVLSAAMPLVMDSAFKGAALLLLAGASALLLWRASAAARHLVWLVAVLALLLVPVLSWVLPGWRVLPQWAVGPVVVRAAVVPENRAHVAHEPDRPDVSPPAVATRSTLPAAVPEPAPAPPPPAPAPAAAVPRATAPTLAPVSAPWWRTALPFVWTAGCGLLLLRLLVAHWMLRRGASCCAEAPAGVLTESLAAAVQQLGVRQPVRLLVDEKRTIPVVWGVWRHRLMLPAEALTWDAGQLQSVLLHELAHIRRRDTLVQWVTQIACALHWFNPLVWLAAWRLHVERERACDDLVLASGVKASAYAGHLLHVASQLSPARWTAACGLAMARKTSLEGRLMAVLSGTRNRRGVTRLLAVAALLLGCAVAVPVAMLRAAESGAAPDKKPAKSTKSSTDSMPPAAPNSKNVPPHGGEESPTATVFIERGKTAPQKLDAPDGISVEFPGHVVHGADVVQSALIHWPAVGVQPALEHREVFATDAFGQQDQWAAGWMRGTKVVHLASRGTHNNTLNLHRLDFSDPTRVQVRTMSVNRSEPLPDAGLATELRDSFAGFFGLEKSPQPSQLPDVYTVERVHQAVPEGTSPPAGTPGSKVSGKKTAEWRVKFEDSESGRPVREMRARLRIMEVDGSFTQEILRTWRTDGGFWIDFGEDGELRVMLSETQYASVALEGDPAGPGPISFFGKVPDGLEAAIKNLNVGQPLRVKVPTARPAAKVEDVRTATGPGAWPLNEKVGLQISHEGGDKAMLVWKEAGPAPSAPRGSREIRLPAGNAVYAFAWNQRGGPLWLLTREALRRIDIGEAGEDSDKTVEVKETLALEQQVRMKLVYAFTEAAREIAGPVDYHLLEPNVAVLKTPGIDLKAAEAAVMVYWSVYTIYEGAADGAGDPFDPEELKLAAKNPNAPNRLPWLIYRAASVKDASFRHLLEDAALKNDERLKPMLAAYDYAVNANQAALHYLLESLAKSEPGSDSSEAVPFSYVDEWELVPAALEKHFATADGAAGIADAVIWANRACLFPEHHVEYLRRRAKTGTTAAVVSTATVPTHKDARALYEIWQRHARLSGDIPGALIGELAAAVKVFIGYNPTWETVPKLKEILPRLDAAHDWKPADAIALLDEVAAVQDSPLQTAAEKMTAATISQGKALPEKFANVAWGETQPNGLRAAWVLEPGGAEHRSGEALKARLLVHNTGKLPVMVRVPTWHQGGVSARDATGAEVQISGIDWTTMARLVPVRLGAGEFIEINAPGVGLGKDAGRGPWAGPRVGSNVLAKDGTELTLTHGPLALDGSGVGMREDAPHLIGPGWWQAHIKARLARELPLPASGAKRTHLLDRAVRELFATTPTADEVAAFATDQTDGTFDALVQRLAARADVVEFAGSLPTAPVKFRVLPADPVADKTPRVVLGPGEYPLSAGTAEYGAVTLKIVGRPVGDRRTNDAQLLFEATEATGKLPPDPQKLELPDGWGTWAIVCRPSDGFFYLLHKGGVRKIDYTKPRKVTDTPATDLPAGFREEVKRQFDIAGVPAESKAEVFEKPAPPADGKAAAGGAQAKPPEREHLWNDKYAAVAYQTEKDVNFVLVYEGFISTGLSESWASTSGEWSIEGNIHLVDPEKTEAANKNVDKRVIAVKHTSDEPGTLYLDGKAYALGTGRVFVLGDAGEPFQTARSMALRSTEDLVKIGDIAMDDMKRARPAATPVPKSAEAGPRSDEARLHPKHESAQSLLKSWQRYARSDGKIPGALIAALADVVDWTLWTDGWITPQDADQAARLAALEFTHTRLKVTGPQAAPSVAKLTALRARLDGSRDWTPAEAVAMLDELTAITTEPVHLANRSTPLDDEALVWPKDGDGPPKARTLKPGTGEALTWGDPVGGLRAALVRVAPERELAAGTVVDFNLLVQNVSEAAVKLNAFSPMAARLKVRLADGTIVKVPQTTDAESRMDKYTLQPRQVAVMSLFSVGIGERDVNAKSEHGRSVGYWVPAGKAIVGFDAEATFPSLSPGFWSGTLIAPFTVAHGTPAGAAPAQDSGDGKAPRTATAPGRYVLGDGVHLQISRTDVHPYRAGSRPFLQNKATIIFPAPKPEAARGPKPHEIALPNGSGTYGIVWERGAGTLWVLQKDLARKYDFTDPWKVQETRFAEGGITNIPEPLREAMKKVFNVPGAPVQNQIPEKPNGAAADATPAGGLVFIPRNAERPFPVLDAGDGVTLVIHEDGGMKTTRVRIRYTAADGIVTGHDVDVANDFGANREQLAILWVRGTKTFWHVNGEFDGKRLRLYRTDFADPRRIVTAYDGNYEGEPLDALGVPTDVREKFYEHFGVVNPKLVDKSNGLPDVAGEFIAAARPVNPNGSLTEVPVKPAAGPDRRWNVQFVDAATGKVVPSLRAKVISRTVDGARITYVTWMVSSGTLERNLGGDEYAWVSIEDEKMTNAEEGERLFGNVPADVSAVEKHTNPNAPFIVKVKAREKTAAAPGAVPKLPKLPDDAYAKPGVHCQKFREEDAKRPGGDLMGGVLEPSKPDDRNEEPLVLGIRTASDAQWRIGGTAKVGLVVRNRSDSDVKFAYTLRYDNWLSVVAVDEAGIEHKTAFAQDGLLVFQRMLLPAAHVATIAEFTIRFDAEKRDVTEAHVAAFHLPPGKYTLRCKWNDAQPDVAHEGEWTGELVNEELAFTLTAAVGPAVQTPLPENGNIVSAEPGGVSIVTSASYKTDTYPLTEGLSIVVRSEIYHGADTSTDVVAHWAATENRAAAHAVFQVASDTMGNRQPWAVLWENGAPALWFATGKSSGMIGEPAGKTQPLAQLVRIDLSDPENLVSHEFSGIPEAGGPSAAVLEKLRARMTWEGTGTETTRTLRWAQPTAKVGKTAGILFVFTRDAGKFQVSNGKPCDLEGLRGSIEEVGKDYANPPHQFTLVGPPAHWERMQQAAKRLRGWHPTIAGGAEETPAATPPAGSTDPTPGAKLQPATEQKLKWGEAVNGLRMALAWPLTLGEPGLGDVPEFYLVVQNVSDKPVRLTANDAAPNPRRLNLYDATLVSRTVDDVPIPVDWLLQPREAAFVRLFHSEQKFDDGRTSSVLKENVVSTLGQYSYTAEMTIGKAPAGAWTGKLVTGATRGSADVLEAGKPIEMRSAPPMTWGVPKDGLRGAFRVIGEMRTGGQAKAELWVWNASVDVVKLSWTERADIGLAIMMSDGTNPAREAPVTRDKKDFQLHYLVLPAGQAVKLKEFAVRLGGAPDNAPAGTVSLPLTPGDWTLQAKWSDSRHIIDAAPEWHGVLDTGELKLKVTPEGATVAEPAAVKSKWPPVRQKTEWSEEFLAHSKAVAEARSTPDAKPEDLIAWGAEENGLRAGLLMAPRVTLRGQLPTRMVLRNVTNDVRKLGLSLSLNRLTASVQTPDGKLLEVYKTQLRGSDALYKVTLFPGEQVEFEGPPVQFGVEHDGETKRVKLPENPICGVETGAGKVHVHFKVEATTGEAVVEVTAAKEGAGAGKPDAKPPGANTREQPKQSAKLQPATEQKLDWSEPANGLRLALCWPPSLGEPAAGEAADLFTVVQNVSEAPLRLCTTGEAPDERWLDMRDESGTLQRLSSKEPSGVDVTLKLREVIFLRLLPEGAKAADKSTTGALVASDVSQILKLKLRAGLKIATAPAGAWTGTLTTPDTRAGLDVAAPANRKAQELLKVWTRHARNNGLVPGGFIARLGEHVKVFVKANGAEASGAAVAKRMESLLPRLDGSRDWQPAEASALLNDIAAVSDGVLSVMLEEIAAGKVQHGLLWEKELESAPWGQPPPNGLRTVTIVGPGVRPRLRYIDWIGNFVSQGDADKAGLPAQGAEFPLGTALGCRILIHNSGKEPVVFRVRTWHHIEPTVKDGKGAEIGMESQTRFTRPPLVTFRLEPGRFIELPGSGLGLGKYGFHDFKQGEIATWIGAKEGDEVTLTPGPLPLQDWNEPAAADGEPRWWLDFISARLNVMTPIPTDAADRRKLLDYAMRDLFLQSVQPTEEEVAAFLADTSPEALTKLAERLFHRPGVHAWSGPLQSGVTKFRVTSAAGGNTTPAKKPAATPPPADAPSADKPKTGEAGKDKPAAAAPVEGEREWKVRVVDGATGQPVDKVHVTAWVFQPGSRTGTAVPRVTDGGGFALKLSSAEHAVLRCDDEAWVGGGSSVQIGNLPPVDPAIHADETDQADVRHTDPGTPVDFKVWRGENVTGRVLLPDGKPGAGVHVVLGARIDDGEWMKRLGISSILDSFDHGDHANWVTFAKTDEKGDFAAAVPPREARTFMQISCKTKDTLQFEEEFRDAPTDLKLDPAPAGDGKISIQLQAGVRVSGRVLDTDGAPVRQAQVMLKGAGDGSALTDVEGRYELRATPGAPVVSIDIRQRNAEGEVIAHIETGIHAPEAILIPEGAKEVAHDFRIMRLGESGPVLPTEGKPQREKSAAVSLLSYGEPVEHFSWIAGPWGPEKNGLRLAMDFEKHTDARIGGQVEAALYARNVSDHAITFPQHYAMHVGLAVIARDKDGRDHPARITMWEPCPALHHLTLPPGHAAKVKIFTLQIDAPGSPERQTGGWLTVPPGDYKLRARWSDAHAMWAHEGEWTGELETGELDFTVAGQPGAAPEKKTASTTAPRVWKALEVRPDWSLQLERKIVTLDELKTAAGGHGDWVVVIDAGGNVRHETVAAVADVLHAAGVPLGYKDGRVGDGKLRVANLQAVYKFDAKHTFSICRPGGRPHFFTVGWPAKDGRPARHLRIYPAESEATRGRWAVAWEPGTDVLWWVDDTHVGRMTLTDPMKVVVDEMERAGGVSSEAALPEEVRLEFGRLGLDIGPASAPWKGRVPGQGTHEVLVAQPFSLEDNQPTPRASDSWTGTWQAVADQVVEARGTPGAAVEKLISWGEEKDGLRTGLLMPGQVEVGGTLPARMVVRNVSSETKSLKLTLTKYVTELCARNEAGKRIDTETPWLTGTNAISPLTLQAGEQVEVDAWPAQFGGPERKPGEGLVCRVKSGAGKVKVKFGLQNVPLPDTGEVTVDVVWR